MHSSNNCVPSPWVFLPFPSLVSRKAETTWLTLTLPVHSASPSGPHDGVYPLEEHLHSHKEWWAPARVTSQECSLPPQGRTSFQGSPYPAAGHWESPEAWRS